MSSCQHSCNIHVSANTHYCENMKTLYHRHQPLQSFHYHQNSADYPSNGPIKHHRHLTIPFKTRFRESAMRVSYLHKSSDIDSWVQQHVIDTQTQVIGLDIEWKPSFTAKQPQSRTSVLQLAADDDILVVSLLNMTTKDMPRLLKGILQSPHIQKVGVGIDEDAKKILNHWFVDVVNTLDLARVTTTYFPSTQCRSLKSITAFLIDYDMEKSKKIQCSNWEAFPLTYKQIQYAAVDAWVAGECARYFRDNIALSGNCNVFDPILICNTCDS